jgi:nucleoid-associated protein YgaU
MDLISKATDLIKPAKATIKPVGDNKPDGPDKLECMFNPTEYRLSQQVEVNRIPTPGRTGARAQYQSTTAVSLSMQLFFDDFASGKGDVTPQVSTLLSWQQPTSRSGSKPRPPLLSFTWGNKQLTSFRGILTQVGVTYTRFRRDGTPIQAKVDITLEGEGLTLQTTNPTSHAIDSRRVRTLVSGESLQSLAFEEFGRATYWRSIAELNGIDDPLRVEPGRALLIPSVADAARTG